MNESTQHKEAMNCLYCGKEFEVSRDWHVYCSATCRVKDWKKRNSPDDRIKSLEKEVAEIKEMLK